MSNAMKELVPGAATGVRVVNCAREHYVGVHEVKQSGIRRLLSTEYVFYQTREPRVPAEEACDYLTPSDATPEAVADWIVYSSQFPIVSGGAVCGANCIYRNAGNYTRKSAQIYEKIAGTPLE